MAAAGVVLIGVVAFSRLYLGYHWLTDVTASLLLAIAILGLVVGVDAWRPAARRAELTRAWAPPRWPPRARRSHRRIRWRGPLPLR
ncbi:phosphatase PAP2 family protein [Kocuria marina]|nr:phosphatase PAP2 family protein [Kocuria marina]